MLLSNSPCSADFAALCNVCSCNQIGGAEILQTPNGMSHTVCSLLAQIFVKDLLWGTYGCRASSSCTLHLNLCCRPAKADKCCPSTPCQSMSNGKRALACQVGTSSTTKDWAPPLERRLKSTLLTLRSTARPSLGQVGTHTPASIVRHRSRQNTASYV